MRGRMIPLRIVVLVEKGTPNHWINGIVVSLRAEITVPFEVELRTVARSSPRKNSAQSFHSYPLADTLLWVDRQFRRLARLGNSGQSSPAVRAPQLRSLASAQEPVVLLSSRTWDDELLDQCDLVVSTLSDTRELVALSKPDAPPVLWAEYENMVLGSSARGFLRPLADGESTLDVVIRNARYDVSNRIILRSRCAMRSVSPSFNEELLAARTSDLLGLCAEAVRMHQFGMLPHETSAIAETDSIPRPLDVASVLRISRRRLSTAQRRSEQRLQWGLAYRRSAGETAEESFTKVPQSELLIPPPGLAWADPFPVRHQGRDLIFFEQEVSDEGRGHIAIAELHSDGTMGPVHRVLESASHLSYPCVFQSDGEWFMVPESRAEERVSLYRAVDFPFRWQRECDLISGKRLADATLFRRNGQWWMLACRIGAGESTFEDVVGYSSDSLSGPWRPISQLPLSSDATAGRPAGHILETEEGLLRPAQDGSRRYGYGLTLCQVLQITDTGFAEREYSRLAPTWLPELCGVHTFNRSHTLTLVDVLRASK
jgi:hypothetical protein